MCIKLWVNLPFQILQGLGTFITDVESVFAVCQGARVLYEECVKPFLVTHAAKFDPVFIGTQRVRLPETDSSSRVLPKTKCNQTIIADGYQQEMYELLGV
jgi:hypothetical protein